MKLAKVTILLTLGLVLLSFHDASRGSKESPSNLADFTVYSKTDHIKITWVTHGRSKTSSFVIQRSRNGKKFEVLSSLADPGDQPETMEFFEIDNSPLPGWSYYRLVELDQKGDSAFSGVAPVFFGLDRIKRGEVISAKNPLEDVNKEKLSDFHDEQVLLVLRDAEGTEFYVNKKLFVKGGRLNVMAGKDVPQGIYVVTAASNDILVGLEVFADL